MARWKGCEMSWKSHAIRSLLTMGSAMVILLGINFVLTPFVTARLGVDAYGFITLANTVVSYAMMVTTALNSFATRFIGVEYHRGNIRDASGYLSSLLIANGVLCLGVFVAVVLAVSNLNGLLNVPGDLYEDVQYLFVLVFVNFLFSNGSAAFSCAAYVKDRLDLYGLFQSASYIVEAVILLGLYCLLPPHVFYFGLGLAGAGLVLLVGNVVMYVRLCPEIKIGFRYFSWGSVRTLALNGMWNSFNQLGNILNSGLSLLIANIALPEQVMGKVAVAQVFTTVSRRLYQLVSQVFQPMLLKSYSDGDEKTLKKELSIAMKTAGLLGCAIFAGYFAFGLGFNRLWIPGQDVELIYELAVVVLSCEVFVAPAYPLYYIYTLTVKNRIPCIVTIVGGLLSVSMMAMLISMGFDAFAVVVPPTVTNIVINAIVNPLYMARCLKSSPMIFFPSMARIALAGLLMCASFSLVSAFSTVDTWISLGLCVLLCAVIGMPIYSLVALTRNERGLLIRRFATISN